MEAEVEEAVDDLGKNARMAILEITLRRSLMIFLHSKEGQYTTFYGKE